MQAVYSQAVGVAARGKRREKSLPNHANLEAYHKDRILKNENLIRDLIKVFRGGLGLCLYLAQDRPDIEESVGVLSTDMGNPAVRALSALKHLACYLKGSFSFPVVTWERDWKIIGLRKNFHQKNLPLLQWNVSVLAD